MRNIGLVTVTIVVAIASSGAQAAVCGELWFARNQIYKSAGYCFRTTRAIRVFGNAGCAYDDVGQVPLSLYDRQRVAQIVREEAVLGCSD